MADVRPGEYVQSLARGLSVVRTFDADHRELTLSEVARRSGLTRAAARRFLHTLVTLGYVRSDGRLFALRPRVLELGYAYLSSMGVADVAKPHMEALSLQVRESCSLSVLDEGDVVYVARVPTRRIMTVTIEVGTRFPAYATSMGRVLIAAQPTQWRHGYLAGAPFPAMTDRTVREAAALERVLGKVAAQGWCLVDQELEVGLRSMAVPIHDPSGAVVAAMNVSMPTSRGPVDATRREVLPALRASAAEIEADLAAGRHPAAEPTRLTDRIGPVGWQGC